MNERYVHIIRDGVSNKRALIESRPLSDLPRLLERQEGEDEIKKGLFAKLRDSELVDVGLDILSGLGVTAAAGGAAASIGGVTALVGVPIATVGEAITLGADLINAARRALRGEFFNSALYVLFSVPALGDALQASAYVGGGVKSVIRTIKPVLDWMKAAENSSNKSKLLNSGIKLIQLGFKKIPGASSYEDDVKKAMEALASGDLDEIERVADQIGDESMSNELKKIAREDAESGSKKIDESRFVTIVRDRANRAIHIIRENNEGEDTMMKFIEAQREIAPKFRNLDGQKPEPIDNVRQDVNAVVSKINDEFERVGFDVSEYMEALSSSLKNRGVMIDYNFDDYSDRPLTSIDVVDDENLNEARKKGKSVMKKGGKKASAGSVAIFKKAAKKVKGGEEKKKRAGFDAVKKSAEKWGAENPAAVAQATTMVAAGEPVVAKGEKRKLKEALEMYEELLESLTPAQIMLIEGRRRN